MRVHCHVGSQTELVVCFCNDRYWEVAAPQSSLSGGADEHYKVLEITSLKYVLRKSSYSTEFQEENLQKCMYSSPFIEAILFKSTKLYECVLFS